MGTYNLAAQAERHTAALAADHRSLLFEGRWYTVGELHDRAHRLAQGLIGFGVAPGDPVVIVMATTPDVGLLYQALWRAGAVPTPAMFLLPPAELRHILIDSDAHVVVVGPEFLANVVQAADGLDVRIILAGDLTGIPAGSSIDATLDDLATSEPGDIVSREDHDLAALLYTGGTTGRSKGVMLTHANLWHAGKMAHATVEGLGLHRAAVPLPLAHVFGLLVTCAGMFGDPQDVAVLQRWFDPVGLLDLIEELRVDQITLVPTMLKLLLDQDLAGRDLSSLRRVVVGSAPLPRDLLDAFEAAVPSAHVCEGYGLTETSAVATVVRLGEARPGSVGRALPGAEVRVVTEGTLDPVVTGAAGEILVRSPAVAAGYWQAPDATAATFVDGWCRTGDVGVLDEDGCLTIIDRIKDLIIRGGFNIYPRDVEDALHEHPEITGAGVIGRPDATYGEEVVAFVTVADGSDLGPDEVRGWAKEHIGAKSYPREVHVVGALPLTPVLKLDRKHLRTLL